jgi:hypothetical protein
MNNTTIVTNSDGSITRVTVMPAHTHYTWPIIWFGVFLVVVWLLRKVFWQKDSN